MSTRGEQGFTVIEVMISVVLLTIGVMALVSTSAMVSRMVGRGRASTTVSQVASSRGDVLRRIAASTSPGCASAALADGRATTGHIVEVWDLQGNPGDNARDVVMSFAYNTARGPRTDTMVITLYCK